MSVCIVTGSAGLIGSEAARHFAALGLEVVGLDNDMRRRFFGDEASTRWQREILEETLAGRYEHWDVDIRDDDAVDRLFRFYGPDISLIVHTAAQPSHDWAAREPKTDFSVNAQGTLNLLEATRQFSSNAVFIFTSTNKVYGDTPNRLPLVELETRWEIDPAHPYANGIREDMSIDQTLHSLFGASKVAADVLVQEYGRYFDLRTVCFRGGCLTGPNHSGTQLHGFLSYLVKCAAARTPYTVFGYHGKQVRDNIHSADLISAFEAFFRSPRCGEVYNIGGGRFSHCSMLEAISICEDVCERELNWTYSETNRTGDHIWWVSDVGKFQRHYPQWRLTKNVRDICTEIHEALQERARLGGGRMIDGARYNVLGVQIDAVDYDGAVQRIITAAQLKQPCAVSALAVHGVMTGVLDPVHRHRLNHLDLIAPDGQPVRWALKLLYGVRLPDRVYGPNLMLKTCEGAAAAGISVFLFGGTDALLHRLRENLLQRFPSLQIAGMQASRFRRMSPQERDRLVDHIRDSGARITFVGLGCPRQEVWAYEFREALSMPILSVGAAFNFHAGLLPQAPAVLQRAGLEWAFRLMQEPRRLWRRYLYLNPLYLTLLAAQMSGLKDFPPDYTQSPTQELLFG